MWNHIKLYNYNSFTLMWSFYPLYISWLIANQSLSSLIDATGFIVRTDFCNLWETLRDSLLVGNLQSESSHRRHSHWSLFSRWLPWTGHQGEISNSQSERFPVWKNFVIVIHLTSDWTFFKLSRLYQSRTEMICFTSVQRWVRLFKILRNNSEYSRRSEQPLYLDWFSFTFSKRFTTNRDSYEIWHFRSRLSFELIWPVFRKISIWQLIKNVSLHIPLKLPSFIPV